MFLCKLRCSSLRENIESVRYQGRGTDPGRYGTSLRAGVIWQIEKLLSPRAAFWAEAGESQPRPSLGGVRGPGQHAGPAATAPRSSTAPEAGRGRAMS